MSRIEEVKPKSYLWCVAVQWYDTKNIVSYVVDGVLASDAWTVVVRDMRKKGKSLNIHYGIVCISDLRELEHQ